MTKYWCDTAFKAREEIGEVYRLSPLELWNIDKFAVALLNSAGIKTLGQFLEATPKIKFASGMTPALLDHLNERAKHVLGLYTKLETLFETVEVPQQEHEPITDPDPDPVPALKPEPALEHPPKAAISQQAAAQLALEQYAEIDLPGFVASFPTIARKLIMLSGRNQNYDRERAIFIFERFYGFEKPILSVNELSEMFGVSLQNIKQSKDISISRLTYALNNGRTRGPELPIPPQLRRNFFDLTDLIEKEFKGTLLIFEEPLFKSIQLKTGIDLENFADNFCLLLEMLHRDRFYLPALGVYAWGSSRPDHMNIKWFNTIFQRIEKLLLYESALPHKLEALAAYVNVHLPQDKPQVSTSDLAMLLKMLDSVEEIKDGSYRGKFEYLKGRVAQVERILFEKKRPMRVAQMTEILQKKLAKTVRSEDLEPVNNRNIVNHIAGMPERILALGKTGEWILPSWQVKKGPGRPRKDLQDFKNRVK